MTFDEIDELYRLTPDRFAFSDAVAKREREACANRAATAIDEALETAEGESLREHVRAAVMRSNVKVSGPEAALSPEGRARPQGYADGATEKGQ